MPKIKFSLLLISLSSATLLPDLGNQVAMAEQSSKFVIDGEVSDLNLSSETTLDQVISRWGAPGLDGPGGVLMTYRLSGANPRRELWLTFNASGRRSLERALLLVWRLDTVPEITTIFDNLISTRTRRWEQLDFTRPVTNEDVFAAWGPPDSVSGMTMLYWSYKMSNGDFASLTFGEGGVEGAFIARVPEN